MSTQINEAAVARREANRDRKGKFGIDPAAEADLTLDLPTEPDEKDEQDEGFDYSRICDDHVREHVREDRRPQRPGGDRKGSVDHAPTAVAVAASSRARSPEASIVYGE